MKKTLFLIFLMSLTCEVIALPGMVDIQYDYSTSRRLFTSQAIRCQNEFSQGSNPLEQLANNMKQFNCNNQSDPVAHCKCVKTISSNGLDLNTESEKLAIETLNNYSNNILISSYQGDLKQKGPSYNEFLRTSHFDDLYDKCFLKEEGVFKDIATLLKKNEADLTPAQRGKLEYYRLIEKDYEGLRPEDRKLTFSSVMGRFLIVRSSDRQSESIISDKDKLNLRDLPFLNILSEDERVEFVSQRLSLGVTNKNVTKIVADSKQKLIKQFDSKCLTMNSKISEQLENYEFEKKAIIQTILDTGGKEFNSDGGLNSSLQIAAEQAVLKRYPKFKDKKHAEDKMFKAAVSETLFSLDKYFCKNTKEEDTIPIYENLDEQEASNKMIDLISAQERVAPKLKVLDSEIEVLRQDVNTLIDSTRHDEKSLEILLKLEMSLDPKNKVEDGIKVIVDPNNEIFSESPDNLAILDEVSVEHIDENGQKYRIVNTESLEGMKEYLSSSVEYGKSSNDQVLVALAKKEDERAKIGRELELINEELESTFRGLEKRVGTKRAEYVRQRSSESAKVSHHKNKVLNIAKNFNEVQKSNTLADLTYLKNKEKGLKAYFKELTTTEPLVPATIDKKKVISKQDIDQSASSNSISAISKTTAVNNEPYFNMAKTEQKVNFAQISKSEEEKSEKPSSRETQLLNQLESLKKYIENSNKNSFVDSSADKDKDIETLRREVELQKIKNDKIRLENELSALKNGPIEEPKVQSGQTIDSAIVNGSESKLKELEESKASRSFASNSDRRNDPPVETPVNSSISKSSIVSATSMVLPEDIAKSRDLTGANSLASTQDQDKFSLLGVPETSSISLKKSTNLDSTEDSRVVKLEFDLESIPLNSRADFLANLLQEGEDSIIIELPDGEKLILESKKEESNFVGPVMKKKQRDIASEVIIKPKRDRILYKDLQKILNSSLSSQ